MQNFASELPFATDYFRQLANLSENFEASDKELYPLTFSEAVSRAAALVSQQSKQQRKVIFIGNGGSAAVASHQAIDYWRNGGFPSMAFNDGALLTCISNDFGYEQVFSKPIATFAQSGDIVFAISSSGKSANILAGATQAAKMGCYVITLSAFAPDNPLRQLGDLNFYVPTMAYGFAEITHLCICHCILDGLMKGSLPETDVERSVINDSKLFSESKQT
ncbi:MAG: SIS domain-containing protein [Microcoleus sp. PH2017_10_PVI_O_A]|uniref:SIS domain-containing protein n=1 Tax=unclassified Microcoleus TaxID=2642155 RepID=UPI001DDAC2EC|nr:MULTISPECIES: SIS domain-containing protein [unclassified Microcoleus]TAE80547.1 MAG: SIS domain-containing protein [Oscillatoriales cyanobacterium]MCC3405807.1 SIS domain-containing protein [Microcoleus sp. PH2017_10_PVI_O_A]MCC3459887.1 SIS domain-containing protein [Microcoleus sp. PH2017_11_PCY_U_A]MCC3478313.1 SIS domain-containing protein [Microcoleus sp. PH2017_12_PCY_D_A]MCC3559254.1 SIS domain-containing protein [Microcoleus sp. PH2017_27_LUM_O_A]